jgi:two-component system sensor histidine kinase ChvG
MTALTQSKITQGSVTAGGSHSLPSAGSMRLVHRVASSMAAKLALVAIIFVACPIIIYFQFRHADMEKNELLLRGVREQGRLVARGLEPFLDKFDGNTAAALRRPLERLSEDSLNIKVFFRPVNLAGPAGAFFYVASAPPSPPEYLAKERQYLVDAGILNLLSGTCRGDHPLAVRYTNPAGKEEILSSLTPVNSSAGCWALLTSHTSPEFVGSSLGRSYWQTPEVQLAFAVYILMAALVLIIFIGIGQNLRRFARLAHTIRTQPKQGASFVEQNRMPELTAVAAEFDRLVGTLRESAVELRDAAEENAHAFKTPIAVIAQSLEPLRRAVPESDTKGRRALQLIERSIDRLDSLIGAARHMDELLASLIDAPKERINLSELLKRMLEGYRERMAEQGLSLRIDLVAGLWVRAGEEILEVVFENLIENAASFSPHGGTISVTMVRAGNEARVLVEDEGPGVDPRNLERIFDRYFSHRPKVVSDSNGNNHFGIGLWIVRRNITALGGTVRAVNRSSRGLVVSVGLPLVP